MAMRCFGRALDVVLETLFAALAFAFGLAAATRPFDLMVLRAEDLAAAPRPLHLFFTAVLAAAFDVAFCLAIGASRLFDAGRLTQNEIRRVGKGACAVPTIYRRTAIWNGGHA